MPRGVPQVPGQTRAEVTESQRASEGDFTPPTPPAEVVAPAADDGSKVVKTTATLNGSVEQQMAAVMARLNEVEESNRQLKQSNADLQGQLRKKADELPKEEMLPTVRQAQAQLDAAESAIERRPVKTTEGWLVHPKAFETPNADVERLLKAVA